MMNENPVQQTTVKEDVRAMKILSMALMTGVVLFAVLIGAVTTMNGPLLEDVSPNVKKGLLYISFGVGLVCMGTATTIYQKKIQGSRNGQLSLKEKISGFRSTLILYMALCEGAALFSIIVLFLTGNYLALLVTAVMLLMMFRKIPFNKFVTSELQLDWNEEQQLA